MITNQVMKRPMGNFLVEQRTKDSMFNATNLLKQWNEFVEHNDDTQKVGYVKKDLDDFFNNKGIKEFINEPISVPINDSSLFMHAFIDGSVDYRKKIETILSDK